MTDSSPVSKGLMHALVEVVWQAGEIIMQYYDIDSNARIKDDKSPVTDADVAANHFIVEQLQLLAPHIPVISEEAETQAKIDVSKPFFLVDPLDGTKSFLRKTGQFTVNIGLIENHQPTMGIIYIPVQKTGYMGAVGEGAFKWWGAEAPTAITTRPIPKRGADVVVSHSHRSPETDAYLATLKTGEIVSAASSLKFCVVAEGGADIYPRFGRTMEWDTAAGHAILSAAGGCVLTPEGTPFLYGKQDFANGNFIAFGERK